MSKKIIFPLVAIAVLTGAFFSFRLGSALPIIESEKFYYQSVKEMFERGDLFTPYYQGKPRFQKPILFYWLIAASYKLFGINNFAARFPSAVAAVFTVLLTYLTGGELFDRRHGLLAASICATTFLFFTYARYSSPDMALAFLVLLALFIFLKAYRRPEKRTGYSLAFFAALGLGMLNKGYVGVLLPVVVALVFLRGRRNPDFLRSMNIGRGLLLFAVIAMPWYILMVKIHGPAYLGHVLGTETIARVFHSPIGERGLKFWPSYLEKVPFYIPVLIGWFLPYSLFLPQALVRYFPLSRRREIEGEAASFLLSYFFGIFVFFTIVSVKEYHYMLPLTPAFAMLTAGFILSKEEGSGFFGKKSTAIPYAFIIAASFLAAFAPIYATGHIYGYGAVSWGYLILAAPVLLILPLLIRRAYTAAAALPLAMMILLICVAGRFMPLLNDNYFANIAAIIKPVLKEGDLVGVGSTMVSQQQLGIYLDRHISEPNSKWGYDCPDRPAQHRQKLREFFDTDKNAYCVIAKEDYDTVMPEDIAQRLRILDMRTTWRSRLYITKETMADILRGKKDLLKDVLRVDMLLVGNDRD